MQSIFGPTNASRKKNIQFDAQLEKPVAERINASNLIRIKYPKRIPIICEIVGKSKTTMALDGRKFLVPGEITIGQFLMVVRKRVKLGADQALFMFMEDGSIPSPQHEIADYDKTHRNADGFLYIAVTSENAFG
jgi:GABA(A) receptor-associated protein